MELHVRIIELHSMATLDIAQALFRHWQDLIAERQRIVADVDRRIADVQQQIVSMGVLELPIPASPTFPPLPAVDDPDYLLEVIRRNGVLDYAALARTIFGKDSETNRTRIRQRITYLHMRRKVIRKLRYGRYEIVPGK